MRRLRKVTDPQAVIVVTSDRAVQQAADQARVRTLGSHEFVRQLFNNLPGKVNPDEGSQAEVKLSPDEVDEWLSIFKQQSDDERP